jgi:hypothetical protein
MKFKLLLCVYCWLLRSIRSKSSSCVTLKISLKSSFSSSSILKVGGGKLLEGAAGVLKRSLVISSSRRSASLRSSVDN